MSMILVVEPDRSFAEQLADALHNAGWSTEMAGGRTQAIAVMAEQQPEVVIVDIAVPEAEELLAACAAGRGGPGSIAVVPAPLAGAVSADDYRADAIITKPFSDDQLKRAIEACVLLRRQRRSSPAPSSKDKHLSSQDIFGDILAEVESSVMGKASNAAAPTAKPVATPPQADAAATMVMPTLSGRPAVGDAPRAPVTPHQPAKAKPPPAHRAPAKPAADDLEERLQKTLSGLLDSRTTPRQAAKGHAKRDDNLDDLLDRTLGPLVKVKRSRPPARSAPPSPPSVPAVPKPAAKVAPAKAPAAIDPATLPQIEPLRDAANPGSVGAHLPSTDQPPRVPFGRELATPSITESQRLPLPTPPSPLQGADPGAAPFFGSSHPPSDAARSGKAHEPEAPRAEAAPNETLASAPTDIETPSAPGVASLTTPAAMDAQPDPYRTQLLPTVPNLPTESGQVLGDYTLIERIAVGGMAEVWKARRRGVEGFEKIVAIKRILAHLTDSPELVSMLIDEAKLAARLSNPNIVQIYDLGKVEDDFFIAMEYVDGTDLRSALKAARQHDLPMPVGVAIMVTARLARALDYAHRLKGDDQRELGLIHRDVSPQNVLISNEGDIKLCDFGIAKAVTSVGHTQMGALKGKLQYMSPEQAWGKKLDARSDIFSLGAVLFEVLTGTKLFTGDSEIGVLDAVRDCRLTSPRAIDPDIPEEAERIVLRALAKVPEDRYQRAGALAAELESVLASMPVQLTQADLAAYIAQVNATQSTTEGTDEPSSMEASSASAVVEATRTTDPATAVDEDAFDALAEDDAGSRRGRWLLIATVIALLVLGGLWLFIFGRSAPVSPGAAARSAPEASTPVPAGDTSTTVTQAKDVSSGASASTSEEDAGAPLPAAATDEPDAGSEVSDERGAASEPPAEAAEAGADTPATAPAETGVDLEKMVAEELARRTADIEAKMQAEYRREQERLAAELADAQARSNDLGEAPDEPATESDVPPPDAPPDGGGI